MKKKISVIATDRGFSLIEMMIAIFVVGMGLVGVVSFFNASLASQMNVKNELIANGLAQEGAELVRNLRDYKVLQEGVAWSDLIDPSSSLRQCRRIDYRSLSTSPHDCTNVGNDYVCVSSGKYFQCTNGSGTGMKRTILVTYDNVQKCLVVSSTVEWGDRTLVAKDFLYENEF